MNIAIIGAGFTGLAAAIELQKKGHTVTLFEREPIPGGLAIGFKQPEWEWSLEKHYHHIFTTDSDIRAMAAEVGVDFTFPYPSTSWLIGEEIHRVDSPMRLLSFPKLPIIDRLRMAFVLGLFKVIPYSKWLEETTAHEWLPKVMGQKGYNMFWEPLLVAKFGEYFKDISLAWFWARIKARSPKLGYPEGGFQQLVDKAAEYVEKKGATFFYNSSVTNIENTDDNVTLEVEKDGSKSKYEFDQVLVTVPNIFFNNMAPSLPVDYKDKLLSFKGIGAVNMVLELDAPFFTSDVYWLSICNKNYPFLAVVEHTHFIDKKHYNNRHLVYVGNYLSTDHRYFSLTKEELLKEYDAHLKKLCPDYDKHLKNTYIFKVPFAQPVVTKNFSEKILPFETPMQNVFLANMQQVYPWDRGTNYAVELGKKVAGVMGK